MKKRLVALVLSLVMATTAAQAARTAEFIDVHPTDWFCEGVQYVYESGLMNGTGEGRFSPNQSTTRGMIVTIIHRMEGTPEPGKINDFSDVAAGSYYEEAVAWASANGIVSGYGGGIFGPNDTITRQQLAAILFRYAGTCGYEANGRADLTGYTDFSSIASWASDAMAWAVDIGLISGTDAVTLSPNGYATRAQVAIILMRFCEKFGEPDQEESAPDTPVAPSTPVNPENPDVPAKPDNDISYEEYLAMDGDAQLSYMESFDSIADFFVWLNDAKAEYEASQDRVDIGEGGSVDIGDYINGND